MFYPDKTYVSSCFTPKNALTYEKEENCLQLNGAKK